MYLYLIIGLLATYLYSKMPSAPNKPIESSNEADAVSSGGHKFEGDVIPDPSPLPAFFFSHGGPTFMYPDDPTGNKGAWKTVRGIGKDILKTYRPDYIVVVSAHWQLMGSKLIEIATPGQKDGNLGENPLIYDFYGFPDHMYKEKFRTMNSDFISQKVRSFLEDDGFTARLTKRGLDHGVWVPLKIAFSNRGEDQELDLPHTPLIQVSLPDNDKDFDAQYRMGQALGKLRRNLIWDPKKLRYLKGLVICSGMSVHNLRDLGYLFHGDGKPLPYTTQFTKLIKGVLKNGPNILNDFNSLKTEHKSVLYKAHPTLEHFAPLVVGTGLIAHDYAEPIKELYNDEVASLGWGIYQFGKDYKAAP